MGTSKHMIALDCGNSSFRVVLGHFDGDTLSMEVIDQYPNEMVRMGEYFYWDFLRIFEFFQQSLKKAASLVPRIDSIGVCTWGVDFGLLDRRGNLLANPLSYRNELGGEQLARLSEEDQSKLFAQTGILCDKINSVYLLAGLREQMPELFSVADKILLAPDLLNYLLTGVLTNELSELSTTQLLDARTRRLSPAVCKRFGISQSLFSPIPKHGQAIGLLRPELREALGLTYDIPVVCVPSHDTAAAVLAIPAGIHHFAFISSGTWSLIGTELDEPIITPAVRQGGLTNEVGAFGRITLLKNSTGMFLIQRIKQEYEAQIGKAVSWRTLDTLAEEAVGEPLLIPINSPRFFNPPRMSDAVWQYLCESGQSSGEKNWGFLIRTVYESMACAYADALEALEHAAGHRLECLYIVGGGSQNSAVNRLTARRTGKTVWACGKESTSLGCLATQLCYLGHAHTPEQLRAILAHSVPQQEYRELCDPGENAALLARYRALAE